MLHSGLHIRICGCWSARAEWNFSEVFRMASLYVSDWCFCVIGIRIKMCSRLRLIFGFIRFGYGDQSFHLWYIHHVCSVSFWIMLSITYPSSPSCTQPTLQVGRDSSICRQCQNSDHASGKEVGFNARDEEDVVQRWSLEVLMGQLDGQFSSEVLKLSLIHIWRCRRRG